MLRVGISDVAIGVFKNNLAGILLELLGNRLNMLTKMIFSAFLEVVHGAFFGGFGNGK